MSQTKKYTRHKKHWTKKELNTLLEQHMDGETDKTIAFVLERKIKFVKEKRTELMRELVNGFTKLDNNGLDEKGIEPNEGYYLTKDEYEKMLSFVNNDLDTELFNLLIKENLEKNAIMNILFDIEWVPSILIQHCIDAASEITDEDVENRKKEISDSKSK